jgi:hypothetical protein
VNNPRELIRELIRVRVLIYGVAFQAAQTVADAAEGEAQAALDVLNEAESACDPSEDAASKVKEAKLAWDLAERCPSRNDAQAFYGGTVGGGALGADFKRVQVGQNTTLAKVIGQGTIFGKTYPVFARVSFRSPTSGQVLTHPGGKMETHPNVVDGQVIIRSMNAGECTRKKPAPSPSALPSLSFLPPFAPPFLPPFLPSFLPPFLPSLFPSLPFRSSLPFNPPPPPPPPRTLFENQRPDALGAPHVKITGRPVVRFQVDHYEEGRN